MKVNVQKDALIELIGKTQNIAVKKTNMKVLSHILLECEDDYLKVYATDMEVSLTDQIKVEVIENGKVVIDTKKFYQIIKELNDGPISLFKNNENECLEISQGKSCMNIMSANVMEYPTFPVTYTNNTFYVQSCILKEMIEKITHSVHISELQNPANESYRGVYFEQLEEEKGMVYKLVSTDGHRLSLITRLVSNAKVNDQNKESFQKILEQKAKIFKKERQSNASSASEDDHLNDEQQNGIVIPRKGLAEIKTLLDKSSEDLIEITIEGVQLIVKQKNTLLFIRLIEPRFPNYKMFIPEKISKQFQISKNQLVSCLRRAAILTTEKSKSVTLFLTRNKLSISLQSPDLGDIQEDLDIDYSGEDLMIEFNVGYLLDILTSFEDESVDIGFNTPGSSGVFRPSSDSNYTCIVMPMRK